MLNAIVRFSIRFRGIAISLACALLVYGIFSLSHVPYDVFPEFAPPEVSIQTEAPGLSPEQVEVLVTQPIENSIWCFGHRVLAFKIDSGPFGNHSCLPFRYRCLSGSSGRN